MSGYRFKARVVRASGAAAWCKENPRPLHADQEEFVVVPLSRALHRLSYDRGVPLRTRLDEHHQGIAQILWATCAALVLLFIALAALDVVETSVMQSC